MTRVGGTFIALVLLASGAVTRANRPTVELGPQPNWDQAVQLGNQALLARLIDPEFARIAWPYRFVGGTLKALFGKTRVGWYTCGKVNARNRMGGYTGEVPFLVLLRDNAIQSLDIGQSDGIDTATVTCNDLAKRGLLQPSGAPSQVLPVAASSAPLRSQAIDAANQAAAEIGAKQGGLGVSFLATPAGVVLIAIAPGSTAELAGLKAGQVIQKANGIDLKGMPQVAAQAVLRGLPKEIVFDVVDVGIVKLTRQ